MKGKTLSRDDPLVTIVTVVKNGNTCIKETVESVLSQNYTNIQYIVIDGCSDDGTFQILQNYKNKIDILVREHDDGIYHAMNKGIQLADGELIGFLNASDILYNDTILNLVNGYRINAFDYSFGPATILDQENNVKFISSPSTNLPHIPGQYIEMPSPHMAVYMKATFIRSLEMFDTRFSVSGDYDLVLRAMNRSKNIWYFDSPVGEFRLGGISGNYLTYIENYLIMKKNNVPLLTRLNLLCFQLIRLTAKNFLPHAIYQFFKSHHKKYFLDYIKRKKDFRN